MRGGYKTAGQKTPRNAKGAEKNSGGQGVAGSNPVNPTTNDKTWTFGIGVRVFSLFGPVERWFQPRARSYS